MTLALLERIAGIMVPVLAMVAVGWLYARRHAPDMSAINRINMDLFAPALIFSALASRDFSIADNRWLLLASARACWPGAWHGPRGCSRGPSCRR